ncbi:MAG: DUF6056 family protein [Anaerolineaceae bacterium]
MKANAKPTTSLKNSVLETKLPVLWALLLALGLTPYLALSGFARPMADDYCSSASFDSVGFWQAQANAFTGWTNRYATMFFTGILDSFGPWALRVLPVLLILGLAASAYLLLKQVFRRIHAEQPRPTLLLYALALTLLTLAALPNLYQSVYWRAGSTAYTLPVIALNLLLAALISAHERKPAWYTHFLFALGAFTAAGFSTANAAVLFTVLAFAFGVLLWRKRLSAHERGLWVSALIGSLLGLLVLALQPGAHRRLAQMPPTPGLGRLIYLTLRHSAKLAYHSLLDYLPARLALLLLGLLSGLSSYGLKIPPFKKLLSPLLLTALGAFLFLAAFCAPSALVQSAYPQARSQSVAVYLISALLLGAGILAGGWLRAFLPRKTSRALLTLLSICTLAALFFALNQVPAQYAEYRRHADAWDAREAVILSQRETGLRTVIVPGLDSMAGLEEISPDPASWVNGCAASYYQLDSIRSTE